MNLLRISCKITALLQFKPFFRLLLTLILAVLFFGTSTQATDKNKLTVINQSGGDSTIKIMGPRDWLMDIPAGQERTILLPAGNYQYLVRYGLESDYRYARGTSFQIEQSRTGFTEASLTLISAPSQSENDPLLIEEFNKPVARSLEPVAEQQTKPAPEKSPSKSSPKDTFILHRVTAGDTLPSITQWYSGEADFWPEVAKYNPNLYPFHLKPGITVKVPGYLAIIHQTPPKLKPPTPSPKAPKKKTPIPLSPPTVLPKPPEGGFGPK